MNKDKPRIFGLDLMRATAILMVVFGHCLWIFPEGNSGIHQLFQLFGFLGVEVFFVLSGFLIGNIFYNIYLKDHFAINDVFKFLKRRWLRTLPNYYLVLLINLSIVSCFGFQVIDGWKYFFFLQNFSSPLSFFFPESWSLSVEEFAYLVLPLFLLFVSFSFKKVAKKYTYIISVLILVLILVYAKVNYSLNTMETDMNYWNKTLKAVVIYRLDSIFIGVIASWISVNYLNYWTKYSWIILSIGVLIGLFLFFGLGYFNLYIEQSPFFWNVVYLPLLSIAIACFLPFLSNWKEEKSFFNRPITFISKISYSVYLLHYSVILYLMKYFFVKIDYTMSQLFLFTLFYLLVTFVFSAILYKFYEKPILDFRDKN
jgi:peptidoglycan/LPS O-acetylase OafA/YrhL